MTNRCEDYPCCGHTDGLGCNWTPESVYSDPHLLCDHNIGVCEAEVGEDHDYDYDDMDGTNTPWCYGCDDYARCGDYTPDPTPTHQWQVTEPADVYMTAEDYERMGSDLTMGATYCDDFGI